jgi:hypothetical protein
MLKAYIIILDAYRFYVRVWVEGVGINMGSINVNTSVPPTGLLVCVSGKIQVLKTRKSILAN